MFQRLILPTTLTVFLLICVFTHYLTIFFNRNTLKNVSVENLTYVDPVRFVFHDETCQIQKGKAFVYDLGGTNCACATEWDTRMYWEKVFSGWAFHLPHLSTPMQMQIIVQKWEWTLLWMCFNEIIEELQLGITGMW